MNPPCDAALPSRSSSPRSNFSHGAWSLASVPFLPVKEEEEGAAVGVVAFVLFVLFVLLPPVDVLFVLLPPVDGPPVHWRKRIARSRVSLRNSLRCRDKNCLGPLFFRRLFWGAEAAAPSFAAAPAAGAPPAAGPGFAATWSARSSFRSCWRSRRHRSNAIRQ